MRGVYVGRFQAFNPLAQMLYLLHHLVNLAPLFGLLLMRVPLAFHPFGLFSQLLSLFV